MASLNLVTPSREIEILNRHLFFCIFLKSRMDVGVWLVLGITSLFLAYAAISSKRSSSLAFPYRKEWLRTYFCRGLDMTGPSLNALWYMDPWLAGPGNSSQEEMTNFVRMYGWICETRFGIPANYHGLIPNATYYWNFRKFICTLSESHMKITMHQGGLRWLNFVWKRTGKCLIYKTTHDNRRYNKERVDFHSFRTKLLEATELQAKIQ